MLLEILEDEKLLQHQIINYKQQIQLNETCRNAELSFLKTNKTIRPLPYQLLYSPLLEFSLPIILKKKF